MRASAPAPRLSTHTLILLAALVVAAPATAAAAAPVRLTAASRAFVDSQGQRWLPAGSRLDGARQRTARKIPPTFSSPKLYETAAIDSRRAAIRVPRSGRYAVTLYLVDPGRSGSTRAFELFSRGEDGGRFIWRRRVSVPPGSTETLPIHAAAEIPVRGRRLDLRFRASRGRPVVSAIEVQRLGPLSTPPVRRVWAETFDGASGAAPDSGRWRIDTGYGWGPGQLQTYTDHADNVALSGDGRLLITARRAAAGHTSARIQTREAFHLTRARIAARIQVPAGRGLWPAFWALGVEPPRWPWGGEVDIMEMLGQEPDHLRAYVHGPVPGPKTWIYQNGASLRSAAPLSSGLHTYEMRSVPGVVEFLLDGRPYGSVAKADLPFGAPWLVDRSYHLILNVAVGGWPGPPDGSTTFPAQMAVDDVTVWR